MWILPRQLHTSGFVRDTEGLSLDLNESSQLYAQSLFVRSKLSPLRTWLQKWKRDSWTQHLFGRILKPSLGKAFEIEWTSLLVATPVSPLAQPESEPGKTTQDTCGLGLQMELLQCDQNYVSSKMSKDISRWGCPTLSKTWQEWVIERRGAYSARLNAARLTSASECLSWPSPVASEVRQGFQDRSRGMKGSQESLTTIVVKSWPTPDTNNHRDGTTLRKDNNLEQGGFHGVSLHHAMSKYGLPVPANYSTHGSRLESWATPQAQDTGRSQEAYKAATEKRGGQMFKSLKIQVESWATPTARDHKSGRGKEDRDYKELTPMVERTQAGKLNPRWVETLMGVPIGWTMPSCTSPATIVQTSCASSETA